MSMCGFSFSIRIRFNGMVGEKHKVKVKGKKHENKINENREKESKEDREQEPGLRLLF